MSETLSQSQQRGNAVRRGRYRERKQAQGQAALVVYVPADVLQAIDAEKTEHALPGRAEAVARMVAELKAYRSGEGEDRDHA